MVVFVLFLAGMLTLTSIADYLGLYLENEIDFTTLMFSVIIYVFMFFLIVVAIFQV